MKSIAVPSLLFLSSVVMALAWLGHLRFESTWSFWVALALSWMLVLPEYALNTAATRWGYGTFSGAQMASMHLSSGVICVALVSRYVLGEVISPKQLLGFGIMFVSVVLILSKGPDVQERSHRFASTGDVGSG